MFRVARSLILVVAAWSLIPVLYAAAADDGPLSLDDIRQMRKQRVGLKQVAEAIEQRGLSFDVDDDAAKKLRTIGFSAKQVAQYKDKYGPVEGVPKPDAGGAAALPAKEEGKKGGKGAGKLGGKPRVLDEKTAAGYKAMEERIEKIAKASGVPVKPHKTQHTTIIANPRIAGLFVPDVQKLEKLLADRFAEPIATGVDARFNNIALLESRYEYENWIKALFKVHKDEGITFRGEDPVGSSVKDKATFVNGIFSLCLEGMPTDDARRSVAFAVGFQYLRQLTGDKAPHALQTGFGNMTEAIMFREPGTLVLSGYTGRKMDGPAVRWGDMVRQQFSQGKIVPLADVLAYSTNSMQLQQYAESWSFTNLLASEPRNFADLVTKLGEGTPADTAISDVYGVNDKQTWNHWKKAVMSGR
ncbi:MAG: hypothetical protein K8T91_16470 [Planctomycetes bacterium]|nr:hypothetical protein [Planctomycetota bacterium]